jgi:hypothetical protein
VPFALVLGWDEEEGRAGRGGANFVIFVRWVEVDGCGPFGFFVIGTFAVWAGVVVCMTCLFCWFCMDDMVQRYSTYCGRDPLSHD